MCFMRQADHSRDIPASELDKALGLEVLEVSATRAVGRLPVLGNRQPFGLLHGGATAALVETLGSLAAAAHAHPDQIPVGVDLNVTHLAAARSGHVTGTATAVHRGRTTAVYQVEVVDDAGHRTAVGRLTCRLIATTAAGD